MKIRDEGKIIQIEMLNEESDELISFPVCSDTIILCRVKVSDASESSSRYEAYLA